MAMLHYQTINADALGTTAGTRESIGSITIPSNATNLWGLYAQTVGTSVTTAAEAVSGKFILEMASLGKKTLQFMAPQGIGGSPATNIPPTFDYGIFHPYRSTTGNAVANETLNFYYDALDPEPTEEKCVQISILSSNGGINQDVLKNVAVLSLIHI